MFNFIKLRKYKYKLFKNQFKITKIENNNQFELIDDNVKCATRNGFYLSDYDEKINRCCSRINNHKIIKRFIDNDKLRNVMFYLINSSSLLLPSCINGTFDCNYLIPSLLLTIPFTYYTTIEKLHLNMCISNIGKYDILNHMEEIYQRIINNFCMLIYKLNITDPIDILIMYCETICTIVDSNDNIDQSLYDENILKIEELFEKCIDTFSPRILGYNVLLGYANCRHQATILKDILVRLGFDASIMILNYEGGIDNNSNHAIVLVNRDNSYIYLDPEHFCNYYINGKKLISEDNTSILTNSSIKYKLLKIYGIHNTIKKNKPICYVSNIARKRISLLDNNRYKNEIDLFNKLFLDDCTLFTSLYEQLISMNNSKKKTL